MEDVLLPQRISGSEAVCGGVEYRVLCVSLNAHLPLKELIALPAAIDIVTDRGDVRSVCGIVSEASAGDSDGGLASYQLVVRDALGILEKRINTRVFRQKSEVQIIRRIVDEWRQTNAVLAHAFRCESGEGFDDERYPPREFTMQYNESDAAFIRRLMQRRGIAWHFRSLPDVQPAHAMVMFDTPHAPQKNAAGAVRYHRDAATEERDSITAWCAVRAIQPGSVTRHSWDYRNPQSAFMQGAASSSVEQGSNGGTLCASLDDYQILPPHVGDSHDDLCRLGLLRMRRHDYESKCFHGQGSVRDLCAGEYFTLTEHPEIDTHAESERDFVVTALHLRAENNLPQGLSERVAKLFAHQPWHADKEGDVLRADRGAGSDAAGPTRTRIHFTAVRLGTEIVPAYDPRSDLPQVRLQSAIVTGPEGEEVHCDALGRVKIRFPGMRPQDHASGPGASGTDTDSAWVRVVSSWAGDGMGSIGQCGSLSLPRVGSEVLVDFLGGDPDKPVIVGQLYNENARPPALSKGGGLPGNRYQSGIKSREIRQGRANQLRFDDTEGQISAQLASDHGDTQLNLGYLSGPRENGRAKPRGEGAELRSAEAIALRAGKGLLLSTWPLPSADASHLQRQDYLALLADSMELSQSLAAAAAQRQAMAADGKAQQELGEIFKAWENGSNSAPQGDGGRKPVIGMTAPEGICFATAKTIVTYAAANIDSCSQKNTQLSAGQSLIANAGKGISLFSHSEGIKAIAQRGKLLLQSQHDDTELNSAKDVKFTSTEGKIIGMAKEIVLIAEDGSFIKIGGGITLGTQGTITHHGANFPFKGPSAMAASLPSLIEGDADSYPNIEENSRERAINKAKLAWMDKKVDEITRNSPAANLYASGSIGSLLSHNPMGEGAIWDEGGPQDSPRGWGADDRNSYLALGATSGSAGSLRNNKEINLNEAESSNGDGLKLGVNELYADAINFASRRTDVPGSSIAAIIGAEAGKISKAQIKVAADKEFYSTHPGLNPGGKLTKSQEVEWNNLRRYYSEQWDPDSYNSSTGASGLTQFMPDAWNDMARKEGSYLNEYAAKVGYVDGKGVILDSEKLLKLRFDPTLSIVTAAEYDQDIFKRLEKTKNHDDEPIVPENLSADERAKYIYIGHHEGYKGAVSFIQKTLSESRANTLLTANVSDQTVRQNMIDAANGSKADAYQKFLWDYVDNKIQPARYR
nr:type VI secretion system tip protein TssI/VgrG [Pseudoduganella violacea]